MVGLQRGVALMWLSCHTQEEIAEAMGMPRTTIEGILTEMARLRFPSKPGDFIGNGNFPFSDKFTENGKFTFPGKTDEQRC